MARNQARKESTGLSPDELRAAYPEFARMLIHRMNEIMPLENDARTNLDQQQADGPGDEADSSVIDTNADYFLRLANNHQRELIEIRDALDRMHRGVYGVCEDCENPISINRLRKLPYARFCVDCQAAAERNNAVPFPRSRPKL